MTEEFNPQREFYNRLIKYISQGDVELEPEARELVKNSGFPVKSLESALEEGNDNAYREVVAYARICLHIAGGDLELEEAARRLARKYQIIHATELDLALHIAKSSSGEQN